METSLAFNGLNQITGVLYFSGDHFAQLLEGPHAALEALMHRIERDGRHQILMQWPIGPAQEPRWYPSWSLCYVLDERLESMIQARLQEDQPADFTELERSLSTGTDDFHPGAFKLRLARQG